MSKQTRRKYDASFKREAVRMADQSNNSDYQIEQDLGISHGVLYRWRKELQEDPVNAFPGTGHQTALEEEVRKSPPLEVVPKLDEPKLDYGFFEQICL